MRETVFGADGSAGSCPAWSTRTATSGWAQHGAVELDEAIAQAETERDVGALLAARRRFADRHPQPRRPRRPAPHHPRRPASGPAEAYKRGFAIELEDESQLPDAVAEQARWGDGWVKLVGDWIDRDIGDLAPLWSDDVLKAAIDAAHANGARVTAHVFSEDALPGLINAGIDCIEHGTGLTDDTIELMVEHGTALVPTLINIENFPGIADAAEKYPTLRTPHAGPLRDVLSAHRRRSRSWRPDLCGHRRGQHGRPRPDRRRDRRTQGHRHESDRGARRGRWDRPRVAGATRPGARCIVPI